MSTSVDNSETSSNLNDPSPSAHSSSSLVSSSDCIDKVKTKKTVHFNDVRIFWFDRTQGFECIPSDDSKNSITLGMSFRHTDLDEFSNLDDYLKYKRQKHLNRLEEERDKILNDDDEDNANSCEVKLLTSDELVDEANLEEENKKILEIVANRDDYENIEIDLPINTDLFCPVLTASERRLKLKEAGVHENEIDETETKEIKLIKTSREICGCKCSKLGLQCGPDNDQCTCYANGIKCQLDKTRFPCDCTLRKCKNPYGLKRFDQKAVLKHYQEVFSDNYPPSLSSATDTCDIDTNNSDTTPTVKKANKRKRKKNSGCYALTNKKRKTKPTDQDMTNESL